MNAGGHRLWLARHATPLIEAGTCYGSLDLGADPGATRFAARDLAAVLPAGITLYCSPLLRCVQLAQAVHELRPDLSLRHDARLAEMDFGTWEGQRWDAIGKDAIDAWTADFAHHRPGGGETVIELLGRVSAALDEARAASRDTAWITHAGVIRCARMLASGIRELKDASQWPPHAPLFGACELIDLPPPDPAY